MRLIDADKLRHELIMGHDLIGAKYTDMADTVKAIPIEWFEWLLDTMGDGMYNLRAVIKDWERYKEDWGKENEPNKKNTSQTD